MLAWVWDVVYTDEFGDWFRELQEEQQDAVIARVELLEAEGPALGRPTVDTIEGSRHPNMKELRVSKGGAIRILFAFDPRRQAVLLLGGDKSGRWNAWYVEAIPQADDLFDEYLDETGQA
jgi:hypothetical protein